MIHNARCRRQSVKRVAFGVKTLLKLDVRARPISTAVKVPARAAFAWCCTLARLLFEECLEAHDLGTGADKVLAGPHTRLCRGFSQLFEDVFVILLGVRPTRHVNSVRVNAFICEATFSHARPRVVAAERVFRGPTKVAFECHRCA
jgi:hypothetical protein